MSIKTKFSMEHVDVVFKSLRSMAWTLALQGVLTIVFGFLILMYPPLLTILVSAILMAIGIVGIAAAIMIGNLSKFKV